MRSIAPTLSRIFFVLLIVLLFMIVTFIWIIIAIGALSVFILSLTYLFALITGQKYHRICDNSEVLYQLNKFGKYSLVAFAGFGVLWGSLIAIGYLPWPL